jgi:hypothetical protein
MGNALTSMALAIPQMIKREMHLTGSNSTTSLLELPRGYCIFMRTQA